ncbi:MAG: NADH-quinone oxidoreductase subunit C [Phycisphaeraceae bacterium]|nr:NADH-quinone oxidoreductase subunit C [Phycisphaeraceae bacterium]
MTPPNLDHPTLAEVKSRFGDRRLLASEFRGQTTLVVEAADLHDVLAFLRDDQKCQYDHLIDLTCVDYLRYPRQAGGPEGRFGVIYNLYSREYGRRLFVKVMCTPTLDTSGTEDDPALHLPTVTDLWPGVEWSERETFDMFGIRFDGHPDLRRILTFEAFPAHALRKDYPLRGRGERETYEVVHRDDA